MRFDWKVLGWWIVMLVTLALILVLVGDAVAIAARPVTYSSWVMCQPDSRVNIRNGPDVSCDVVGYCYPGDELTCDMVDPDGWVHAVDLPCDADSGWVYVGYLTVEEPRHYAGSLMQVSANGRVAVRSHMCGERRMWVQPGSQVEVYQLSEGWAVTSLGFIRSEYLAEVR